MLLKYILIKNLILIFPFFYLLYDDLIFLYFLFDFSFDYYYLFFFQVKMNLLLIFLNFGKNILQNLQRKLSLDEHHHFQFVIFEKISHISLRNYI